MLIFPVSFMASQGRGVILNPTFAAGRLDGGYSIAGSFVEGQAGAMRVSYSSAVNPGPGGTGETGVPFGSFPMRTVPGETYTVTYTTTEISANSGVAQLRCDVYDAAIYSIKDLNANDIIPGVTGNVAFNSGTFTFSFVAQTENTSLIFTFGGDFGVHDVSFLSVYGKRPENDEFALGNTIYDVNILSAGEGKFGSEGKSDNWITGPNAVGSFVNGQRYRLFSNDGNSFGSYAEQTIKTIPGQEYYLRFESQHTINGREPRIEVLQTSDTSLIASFETPAAAGIHLVNGEFTATEETTLIRLRWDAIGAGNWVEFISAWVSIKSPADNEVVLGLPGDGLVDWSGVTGSPDVNTGISTGPFNAVTSTPMLRFNGTSGQLRYANVDQSMNLGTDDFTIEFYATCENLDSFAPALSFGGANNFTIKRFNNANNNYWYLFTPGTGVRRISPNNVPTNELHHICVERYNGFLYLYYDGRLVDQPIQAAPLNMNGGNNTLIIGTDDSVGEWFEGTMSDFRISNVAKYRGFGFIPPVQGFDTRGSRIIGEIPQFPAQSGFDIVNQNKYKRSRNTFYHLQPPGGSLDAHYVDNTSDDGGGWIAVVNAWDVNNSKLNTGGFGGTSDTFHPKRSSDWKISDARIIEFKYGSSGFGTNDKQNFRITMTTLGDTMYYQTFSNFIATQNGGNTLQARSDFALPWSVTYTAWTALNDEAGFLTKFINATTSATHGDGPGPTTTDGSAIGGGQAIWSVGAEQTDAMFRAFAGVLWTR